MTVKDFIIFLHIHKCAGLSFKRVLRAQFGPSIRKRLLNRLQGVGPLPLPEAMTKTRQQDRYFAGHFGFGVHECLPQPCLYATFLRKPEDRLVSLYDYSRNTPEAFYHKYAVGKNFKEFVTSGDVFETDNGMTRFLIGDESRTDYFICRRDFGTIGEADVSLAIGNLKSHFLPPGITEQFDKSMLILREKLGLQSVKYLRLNERGASEGPKTKWDPALEPYVVQDRILYDWALQRHIEAWNDLAEHTPDALASFQKALARYQSRWNTPYKLYQRARQRVLD